MTDIFKDLGELGPTDRAARVSADAYGQLLKATADICQPRYHYYCLDEQALPPPELIIAVNTRRIPIAFSDEDDGALEVSGIKERGPDAGRLSPRRGARLKQWRDEVAQDFRAIGEHVPDAQYICLPEFGFPFALRYMKSLEIPKEADAVFDEIVGGTCIEDRFVCMGTAHRKYHAKKNSIEYQYENVGVVFPEGRKENLPPNIIFRERLAVVKSSPARYRVDFDLSVDGIIAKFKSPKISATSRTQLSQRAYDRVTKENKDLAKAAFDYYAAIAKPRQPPIYIKKKRAARKLGEWIDGNVDIEIDVFVTRLGVVATLVCFDVFDPSIFLSAVRMFYESSTKTKSGIREGFSHQAVDVFFVPAFNKSPKFTAACEILSRETNSVVVYVSGDEGCKVRSEVYICGRKYWVWDRHMKTRDVDPDGGAHPKETVKDMEHLHVYRLSKDLIAYAKQSLGNYVPVAIRNEQLMEPRRLGPDAL